MRGDTVIVVDERKLHLFDPEGQHLRDRRLSVPSACPAGRVLDGASSPGACFYCWIARILGEKTAVDGRSCSRLATDPCGRWPADPGIPARGSRIWLQWYSF